ncbi:MAG: hypothetical protein ACK4F7_03725 [Inhella sp.]
MESRRRAPATVLGAIDEQLRAAQHRADVDDHPPAASAAMQLTSNRASAPS